MYSVTRINKSVVKVIPVPKVNDDQIKGFDIIPMLYANIFVCARKGSGKTNVVFHIMKSCIDKDTIVIVFSATHNSDDNWIYIKKWLEKKEIHAVYYDCIRTHEENHLDNLMEHMRKEDEAHQQELQQEKKAKEEAKNAPVIEICKFDCEKDSLKIKIKKKKQTAPKYLIIFDDMSQDLQDKKVAIMLKNLRHYKSKTIISSQYPNDISKPSRVQIDFWMLFKGFEEMKIEEIFPQLDLQKLTFEQFWEIYKLVTNVPHQFLYIDKKNAEMRVNFDQRINF